MSMMSIYLSIRACESLVYVNDMQVIDIDKHFHLSIKILIDNIAIDNIQSSVCLCQ